MRTNSTTDHYCPNCRQMVRPKIRSSYVARVLVAMAIVGTYWFISLTQPWHAAAIAAAMTGIVATAFALKYDATPHCPICKTDKLEQAAPVV